MKVGGVTQINSFLFGVEQLVFPMASTKTQISRDDNSMTISRQMREKILLKNDILQTV